jgi:hypothetical protein
MKPACADSLAVIGLAAIVAACCGLPLVAAALAGAGAGTWLTVHGSAVAIPVLAASAAMVWWRWGRGRR